MALKNFINGMVMPGAEGRRGSGASNLGAARSVRAVSHSDDAADLDESELAPTDTPIRRAVLSDFEALGVGWIWASDAEGKLTYLTKGAAEALGREMRELIGHPVTALMATDAQAPDDNSGRSLNFRLSAQHEIEGLTVKIVGGSRAKSGADQDQDGQDGQDGSPGRAMWWTIRAKPAFDDKGEFVGYRGHARDVSRAVRETLAESRLAECDSLTGLANRHRIEHRLDATLKAYRGAKRSCALLMLDLDRFKYVNDTLGHQAGDDILRQVAERLKAVITQAGAEIGRLGGDEFQVIIPDIDDRGTLGELADKIIQIVSQPYSLGEKRASIGTSVGIAIAPYDGLERADLTHAADLALYAAKHGGRCAFRFYSSDMQDEAAQRDEIEQELRAAFAAGELELHYQPVMQITDNAVEGCEALLRWDHPERGMLSPEIFIPIAEDSDLIVQIGEWVLRRACEDACEWPDAMRVSVNVSPVQFACEAFPAIVANVLAASGLEPSRLELELPEAVLKQDSQLVERNFATLKKLGVRLALDDFGMGYSSLSYLRCAPFDRLKVDKSFVEDCTSGDREDGKMVSAIISLADALGMDTTVEGVEALDQLELVRSKGAKSVQGWVFSPAIPHDILLERLEDGEMAFSADGPHSHREERRSVFRRIGVIHQDHYYQAVVRDLSARGARIVGLNGVAEGMDLVLDFGEGQLSVGRVRYVEGDKFGMSFETPLVSNGAGGLCTRHRVSPYALAAAGMPLAALPPGSYPIEETVGEPSGPPQLSEVVVGT